VYSYFEHDRSTLSVNSIPVTVDIHARNSSQNSCLSTNTNQKLYSLVTPILSHDDMIPATSQVPDRSDAHVLQNLHTVLGKLLYVYFFRVRPIPVSGIGRYSPILVGIGISPIPVVLSFVYLSQQSTLLQRTPIAYTIFLCNIPHIHITCTHLYPAQNRIFSTKKFVQPGIGIAAANSIGYQAPARYQSNPILFLVSQFRHQ